MKIPIAVLSTLLGTASIVHGGQETLRELLRRYPGPIGTRVVREFSPVHLADLAKACDLIARVVISDNGRALLSADEESIYSEVSVQILDEFFSTRSVTPGEQIIVSKPGGTLTIEGREITSREADFPPFAANEEYILFLKFDSSTGRYVVPYGAQGAFRITSGMVDQVSTDTGTWNREKGRVPVLDFIREVQHVLVQQ